MLGQSLSPGPRPLLAREAGTAAVAARAQNGRERAMAGCLPDRVARPVAGHLEQLVKF